MDEARKRKLHQEAQRHVDDVCLRLGERRTSEGKAVRELREGLGRVASFDRHVQQKVLAIREEGVEALEHLAESPYFFRCDLRFAHETEVKTYFFSKFSQTEFRIFSWVAPISAVRHEEVGHVAVPGPGGASRPAELLRKEQFMIVKGKILFMTSATEEYARTLIYQDYFSQRKSVFALTDIVDKLEKAQDQVIRAPVNGPMRIEGPAGSGKTTLALHRLAYLAQAPETSGRFPASRMLVLVQDSGSQAYFARLLPELGIHDVTIQTFDAWACSILGILPSSAIERFGVTEEEKDLFEWRKREILREPEISMKKVEDAWQILEKRYRSCADPSFQEMWRRQREARCFDRFDLVILLRQFKLRQGGFVRKHRRSARLKNGKIRERVLSEPIAYAAIVVDEVQNRLPEQISILREVIEPATGALLYIGDLAQQTRIGTLRRWEDVGEAFAASNVVVLQTVYRNTRQILSYVERQGYRVAIPERAQEGEEVMENRVADLQEAKAMIREYLREHPEGTVGVLSLSEDVARACRDLAETDERVHCLGIREAQGVEFDAVFLLRTLRGEAVSGLGLPPAWEEERARIQRDLLYVALTRAMSRLAVIWLP